MTSANIMRARRRALSSLRAFGSLGALGALAALAGSGAARAQVAGTVAPAASMPDSAPSAASSASAAAADTLPVFVVEIRTGPGWDPSKPPQAQARFREHSAHLRRLRDEGQLVLGARVADKGLLVVAAADLAAVRRLFDADASVQAGTFVYEAHAMAVFYGGCVQPPRRRSG